MNALIDFQKGKLLLAITLLNLALSILSIVATMYGQGDEYYALTAVAKVLSVALLLVLLQDVVRNRMYHKPYWIISLIFLLPITAVYYLMQRQRLIRLESKFQG